MTLTPLDILLAGVFLLSRNGLDVEHNHDFSEPVVMTMCFLVDPKAKRVDSLLDDRLVDSFAEQFGIVLKIDRKPWTGRTYRPGAIDHDLAKIQLEAPCDGYMVLAHRRFLQGVIRPGATDLATRTKSFCYVSGIRLTLPSAKTCVAHEIMHQLGFDHALTREEGYETLNHARETVLDLRLQFDHDFFPRRSSTLGCWYLERPVWVDGKAWIKCST